MSKASKLLETVDVVYQGKKEVEEVMKKVVHITSMKRLFESALVIAKTTMEVLYPKTMKKILSTMKKNGWKETREKRGLKGKSLTFIDFIKEGGMKLEDKAMISEYNWDNKQDGTYIIMNTYNFAGMSDNTVAKQIAMALSKAGLKAKASKRKGEAVVTILEIDN